MMSSPMFGPDVDVIVDYTSANNAINPSAEIKSEQEASAIQAPLLMDMRFMVLSRPCRLSRILSEVFLGRVDGYLVV